MDTVSCNYLPVPTKKTPFKIWLDKNNVYLRFIFEIFLGELDEIKDTDKNYITFARMIYKKSSRTIN